MGASRRTFLKGSLTAAATPLLGSLKAQTPAEQGMGQARFVDVSGIRTRYFEAGAGKNLVLIHGGQFGSLSYSADVWNLNFHALSRQFRVYAFDKPGQGFSDNPPEDSQYTMEAVIRHTAGFLEKLGLERVTLLGHSRGALPAAHIAIHQPQRIEKLIIADSNTLAPSSHSDFYQKLNVHSPATPTLESIGMEPAANSFSDRHVDRAYLERLLEAALLPKTREVTASMQRLRPQFLDSVERIKKETLDSIARGDLKTPTLIVWGYNDPSAPLEVGLDLLKIFAPSVAETQFHIFNQAGHYAFREEADAFNRLVTHFIPGELTAFCFRRLSEDRVNKPSS